MWAYSTSTILILTTIELRYIVIIYVVEVQSYRCLFNCTSPVLTLSRVNGEIHNMCL